MGWMRQMLRQGWEPVDYPADGWTSAFLTFRRRVDGGWLYRSVFVADVKPEHATLVYVPDERAA